MSDDARVIAEVAAVSDIGEPHTVLHYLYTPGSEAAKMIAHELRQRGFRTQERLGGDGVNWLVLACHEVVPTQELMASLRQFMEKLVAPVGGEYDGWEADVRDHDTLSPPHLAHFNR
jgi:hypothetical protein